MNCSGLERLNTNALVPPPRDDQRVPANGVPRAPVDATVGGLGDLGSPGDRR